MAVTMQHADQKIAFLTHQDQEQSFSSQLAASGSLLSAATINFPKRKPAVPISRPPSSLSSSSLSLSDTLTNVPSRITIATGTSKEPKGAISASNINWENLDAPCDSPAKGNEEDKECGNHNGDNNKVTSNKHRDSPFAAQVWQQYCRAKDLLPNGRRLENLTWRMMAMRCSTASSTDTVISIDAAPDDVNTDACMPSSKEPISAQDFSSAEHLFERSNVPPSPLHRPFNTNIQDPPLPATSASNSCIPNTAKDACPMTLASSYGHVDVTATMGFLPEALCVDTTTQSKKACLPRSIYPMKVIPPVHMSSEHELPPTNLDDAHALNALFASSSQHHRPLQPMTGVEALNTEVNELKGNATNMALFYPEQSTAHQQSFDNPMVLQSSSASSLSDNAYSLGPLAQQQAGGEFGMNPFDGPLETTNIESTGCLVSAAPPWFTSNDQYNYFTTDNPATVTDITSGRLNMTLNRMANPLFNEQSKLHHIQWQISSRKIDVTDTSSDTEDEGFTTSMPTTAAPSVAISSATAPTTSNETQCTNCSTKRTPLWRRDEGGKPLCNACGLFLKLHGRVRPLSLKTDVIKKRVRGGLNSKSGPAAPTEAGRKTSSGASSNNCEERSKKGGDHRREREEQRQKRMLGMAINEADPGLGAKAEVEIKAGEQYKDQQQQGGWVVPVALTNSYLGPPSSISTPVAGSPIPTTTSAYNHFIGSPASRLIAVVAEAEERTQSLSPSSPPNSNPALRGTTVGFSQLPSYPASPKRQRHASIDYEDRLPAPLMRSLDTHPLKKNDARRPQHPLPLTGVPSPLDQRPSVSSISSTYYPSSSTFSSPSPPSHPSIPQHNFISFPEPKWTVQQQQQQQAQQLHHHCQLPPQLVQQQQERQPLPLNNDSWWSHLISTIPKSQQQQQHKYHHPQVPIMTTTNMYMYNKITEPSFNPTAALTAATGAMPLAEQPQQGWFSVTTAPTTTIPRFHVITTPSNSSFATENGKSSSIKKMI